MSYKSAIHCDNPNCITHIDTELIKDAGFFTVFDGIYPTEAYFVKHFCSWDCIMHFAATMPPLERFDL